MKKLAISSRFAGGSGLVALLALGTAASSFGCSKPEEEKKPQAAWSCTRDEVPMGEVLRCTSSAATADGPVAGSSDATSADDETTSYECNPAESVDCPPADATGGTSDGATNGGAAGGDDPSGGGGDGSGGGATGSDPVGTNSGTGGSSGKGGGASGSGGTSGNGSKGSTNSSTSDGGGTSHEPGPDECSYVPDLEYCGGAAGGGSSDSSGTSGCTTPGCGAPGQDKKGSTDGAGASSSGGGSSSGGASSSGGGGGGGGGKAGAPHFKCTKDKKGNKTCVSTPDCAKGSHASACGACVSDSEGASDCVPQSEGGCWVTGGGFIEGASLVPSAAADGKDNFGGNAKPMKKGGVSGHWNHVDHGTGNHAKGRPEYIMCRVTDGPGPKQPGGKKGMVVNQVYFGGHAQWRDAATATWSDGYWFDVVAEDHGEPGNTSALKNGEMPDSYHFTIRKIANPTAGASGTVVYETRGDLSGGNIQLHPSNGGHPAVSSPLPAWVSIEP